MNLFGQSNTIIRIMEYYHATTGMYVDTNI